MIKKLTVCIWIFIALPLTATAADLTGQSIGIISFPMANVHAEPVFRSRLVTQVLMADEVEILEKRNYRYRIRIPSQGNIEGWVQQGAVYLPKSSGGNQVDSDSLQIVVSIPKSAVTILDKTGNHEDWLYAGTKLPVIETLPGHYKVRFPDRRTALIPRSDARPLVASHPLFSFPSPAEIAETARRFQGIPYRAGGITAQGMDTRGLIYIVYRIHGIEAIIPSSITKMAERVDKKDLLPGDILKFHAEGEGLYIGNGRFLHAVPKRSIQVESIYERRYSNALRHGLRLLGADPEGRKRPMDMTPDEILIAQTKISALPVGKRIVYWASRFIGTPYDPDPLGRYVRSKRIVADDMVDCMYLTFRSVELAMAQSPSDAVERALDLRFTSRGLLDRGIVINYEERFEYGEDMVWSSKWGTNITDELGRTKKIPGSRGRDEVSILPKEVLLQRSVQKRLRDGDIIFWVKDPKKRVVQEIVGHLAIVRIKNGKPYLIHAAGSKSANQWTTANSGVVKEVPFSDYVSNMRFIGALVTRFEE